VQKINYKFERKIYINALQCFVEIRLIAYSYKNAYNTLIISIAQ